MKRECPSLFAALLVSLLVNVLLRSQTAYWPRAGLFSAVVCAPLLAGVGWLFARSWRLAADPVYKLLFAALLVSLLVNVLLRSQTAYWPRAGLFSAVVCAPLLAGVGWLFARSWRLAADPVYKLLFGALLVYTSVLELLRLWQLADRLYPGAVTLTSVCLLVVLPVVYLRRVSALSQTAYAVLCLLVLATVAMLASVLQRLCIVNLQTAALTQGDFLAAVRDQLTLYPEYLLPALWPEQDKRGRHTLLRLAAWALAFDVGMHLILELFYGAAMPLRIDPVHAAARCGALSIFNRLEWLQFILWVMAVTVKLALYLYALVRLLGGQNKAEDSAAGLDRFPLYPGGVWLLCAVLRKLDLDAALSLRNVLTWSFVGLTWIGGAAACLYRRLRRC